MRTVVEIPADIKDVWQAITTQKPLADWLGKVTVNLREGGSFAVEDNASGGILACDPSRALRVDWDFGDGHSVVEAELTTSAPGTALSLSVIFRRRLHWVSKVLCTELEHP